MTIGKPPVNNDSYARAHAAAEAFRHSHQIHMDLRQPPGPTAFGVFPPNEDNLIDRAGGPLFDVDFLLPEGARLHVPAFEVDAVFAGGSRNEVHVQRFFDDLPSALTALTGDAHDLKMAPGAIQSEFGDLSPGIDISLSAETTRHGYLDVDIELRTHADQRSVEVTYLLTWTADDTPA